MSLSVENLIKGRIADVLAEQLLKDLGFFVLPFADLAFFVLHSGREHTDASITDMRSFVKACGSNFKFDRKSDDVNATKKMLNKSPDFIAVHPSGRTELIEVKYRANGLLTKGNKKFTPYPNSILLVINSEMTQNVAEPETPADKQFIVSLRNTRFHIWQHNELKAGTADDKATNPIPLSQWLIEEFKCDKVQVEQIIKEYESYVTQWYSKTIK